MLIAESVSENGKKAWKFLSILRNSNLIEYSTFLAMDGTLDFVESLRKTGWDTVTELSTPYSQTYRVVSRVSGGNGQTRTQTFYAFDPTTQFYYREQIIYLIRCLQLKTGFEISLPIFDNGYITNQRISVEGRETVVTPAGSFNAWKVAYGNKGAETFYWISDDNRRYPVKIGGLELDSISKYEKNKPVEYTDRNISFSLPSGWFSLPSRQFPIFPQGRSYDLIRSDNSKTTRTFTLGDLGEYTERWTSVSIGDPEFETASGITLMEYSSKKDAQLLLSETIDGLITHNHALNKNHIERPGSRENITISGLPAARLIADDKTAGNKDIVIYYYVVSAGDKAVRAFFRSTKEDFDRFRPVFDSIMESIQLK